MLYDCGLLVFDGVGCCVLVKIITVDTLGLGLMAHVNAAMVYRSVVVYLAFCFPFF